MAAVAYAIRREMRAHGKAGRTYEECAARTLDCQDAFQRPAGWKPRTGDRVIRTAAPHRLLLCLMLPLLCGFQARTGGPNGDGTLVHVEDARWNVFHDVQVTSDLDKGEYSARFGHDLTRLNGHEVEVSGYMLPLTPDASAPHFVLTRRSAGCPFCPPNELNEAVEVEAVAPVTYTMAPITISGRLQLVAHSDAGLFFRLDQASRKS